MAQTKIAVTSSVSALLRDRVRLSDSPARGAAQPFQFRQVAATPSDENCLAEAVYFEARGESREGQQAVAQVVLNRVRHPAFPKTVCGVVHQHSASNCQFSFACSRQSPATGSIAWRRAETVASAALHGAVMAAVGDATHFQTARGGPFSGLMRVAQVGAHVFYRFAGHAGSAGMFRQAPQPSASTASIQLAKLEPARAPAPVKAAEAGPAETKAADAKPAATPSAELVKTTPVAATPPKPAPLVAVRLVVATSIAASPPSPSAAPATTKAPDAAKPASPAALARS